jgi:hypothetical protein
MDIVIGCEKSGVIREAFRKRGHNAISVDLEPTELPGPHEQVDIFIFLQKNPKWDMAIFHPECKYLCFSGEKWRTIGNKDYKQGHFRKRLKALAFFKRLWNQKDIPSIVIENSHSTFINRYFKPSDQIVQPYQFGDPYRKQTHLWLKNTPPPNLYVYMREKGGRVLFRATRTEAECQ